MNPALETAAHPVLETAAFRVASDPGIEIAVRNKHPAALRAFAPERTVIYLHGATYPAAASFDLPLGGLSWMDYIAGRGYDVYLLDVRGYGASTRPAAMDGPADHGTPFAHTEEAMRDLDAVVDFVCRRRGIDRVVLLAWSWGTAIAQWYASRRPERVAGLALYAPLWIRETPSLVGAGAGPPGAYRTVTRAQAQARWLTGVPDERRADLIPPGWFDAWWTATLATDAQGARRDPPVLRAPNGVVADGRAYWGAGRIPWDPAAIRAPVLLVRGEWDCDTPGDMARNLFARLTGTRSKRLVELGAGTHTLMMETNRMHLFREVQRFLDDDLRPTALS
ncbi:MAG: alpha/beta fold hydrolase [Burkholderiales bacterium]|nr:alpha/beta fold hydrolase [Burkholderiales bacterium]